jgi:hypothetical protein
MNEKKNTPRKPLLPKEGQSFAARVAKLTGTGRVSESKWISPPLLGPGSVSPNVMALAHSAPRPMNDPVSRDARANPAPQSGSVLNAPDGSQGIPTFAPVSSPEGPGAAQADVGEPANSADVITGPVELGDEVRAAVLGPMLSPGTFIAFSSPVGKDGSWMQRTEGGQRVQSLAPVAAPNGVAELPTVEGNLAQANAGPQPSTVRSSLVRLHPGRIVQWRNFMAEFRRLYTYEWRTTSSLTRAKQAIDTRFEDMLDLSAELVFFPDCLHAYRVRNKWHSERAGDELSCRVCAKIQVTPAFMMCDMWIQHMNAMYPHSPEEWRFYNWLYVDDYMYLLQDMAYMWTRVVERDFALVTESVVDSTTRERDFALVPENAVDSTATQQSTRKL